MHGWLYRTALPVYRGSRRLKNRMLNLVDPPVVVLVYHRVAVLPNDPHLLAVSPENFRAQMQFLKTNVPVVRFEGDWSGLRERSVAVTFDDGYADNILEALPVLKEVGVPATFFVSTGALGTRDEFWWDELERIILGDAGYPDRFRLEDREYGKIWPTRTREQRVVLQGDLQPMVEKIGAARREGWLEQLREWSGLGRTGREANRPMTPEELRILAASPWATVGAHTVTHTPLSVLSEDEQRHEIVTSRRHLETLVGREIRVFSYPFGAKVHYDSTSVRLCREAGFRKAASNFPGQAHRWTDAYQIPRQLVRNWDADTFADRMRSFWI
jgi:peptidoglycan/xylan/chitin deacetylase (PgdA/CDA1 family)